ncbi:MAG: hypothetical protein QM765_29465 [Myxococcales bacterium]
MPAKRVPKPTKRNDPAKKAGSGKTPGAASQWMKDARNLLATWDAGECEDAVEAVMQAGDLLDSPDQDDGSLVAGLKKLQSEATDLIAGAGSKKKSKRSQPSKKALDEARRVVADWTADEYDDAVDALQEAEESLGALEGSGETELVAALNKVVEEAMEIVEDVYDED